MYDPTNNGIFTISTGAGFLPSTVYQVKPLVPNVQGTGKIRDTLNLWISND